MRTAAVVTLVLLLAFGIGAGKPPCPAGQGRAAGPLMQEPFAAGTAVAWGRVVGGTALVLGWLVELLILGYFTHRIMRVEAPYAEAERVEADNRIYPAREETVPRPQSNNRPEEH